MKRLLSAVLLLAPLVAGAQVISTNPPVDQPPAQPQAVPPPPLAAPPPPSTMAPPLSPQGDAYGPPVSEPAPSDQYAQELPPPPATTVAPPSATGQWAFTSQYGWIWMPYGAPYTYLPAGAAYPDMYVYAPAFGWRWVVAPWVWGVGPRPFFGVYGWARYPWWGRGYGRWYGFRGSPVWAGRGWVRPGGPVVHPVAPHVVVRPAPHVVGPRPGPVSPRLGVVVRPGGFGHPWVVARPSPVARHGSFGGARPGGAHVVGRR